MWIKDKYAQHCVCRYSLVIIIRFGGLHIGGVDNLERALQLDGVAIESFDNLIIFALTYLFKNETQQEYVKTTHKCSICSRSADIHME